MVAAKKPEPKPPVEDPELIPHEPGVESWQNTTAGTVFLTRIGEYGKRHTELIYGGRVFSITPQERRINQQACATAELDMFTNGTLAPKSLIDGEPDTARLRDNPNMIDDKEIPRIFRLRGEAFTERISKVSNIATVARLVELAREPRFNVTVHQFEILRRRERALAGETDAPAAPADDMTLPRAVTPR